MKILLISPLLTPLRKPEVYNIGLGYIAASLLEEDHKVEILDIEGYRYSKKKVLNIIRKSECDIIGIGTLITGYKYVKWLIKEIKRIKLNIPIILGSSIAATIPEIAVEDLGADFAVIGEGEITIKELVKTIEEKSDLTNVNGICFKQNGQIIRTPERELIKNLDDLPMPAWDLFPQEIYMNSQKHTDNKKFLPTPVAFISATRGCPYHCIYCYHPFQNQKVRYYSAKRIIEELKIYKRKYNIKSFVLSDDLSIADHKRIYELCDLLEKENLNLKWSASPRVNLVNEKLLKRMKESGVDVLGFGIESGSQKILDNIKKQVTIKTTKRALLLCKKLGIETINSFMIGNIGETRETVFESVSFIKKYIDKPLAFSVTTPYPETELFEYGVQKGLIKDKIKLFEKYGEQGARLLVNFTDLSDEELWDLKHEAESAILKAHLRNHFLKGISYLIRKNRTKKRMFIANIKTEGLIKPLTDFVKRKKKMVIEYIRNLISKLRL